ILEVLDPLEVADDDAAGVGQDVGDDGNPPSVEDVVSVGEGGSVGGLDDQLRLDALGGRFVKDAPERRGDQDVDGRLQKPLVADRLRPLEADDLAGDGDVAVQLLDVQPIGVVDGAVDVGDGDDLGVVLGEGSGR